MPDYLCITVRFLDRRFHGRGDSGEPEWPPSPLRLFQALVAAGAACWNERGNLKRCDPALRWLERQSPPVIVAPEVQAGTKYRLYVPDNVGDLVARSWSRGNPGNIADYRTEKDVCVAHLNGDDAVHYLWPLTSHDSDFTDAKDVLLKTVRAVTHLGWGIDHVVANAMVISESKRQAIEGNSWNPNQNGFGASLRVPQKGTLDDLNSRYAAFLNRAQPNSFAPVPPLSTFGLTSYQSGDEPPQLPFAAFSLLKPDASSFRTFDPVRNGMRVAGMLRHTASDRRVTVALGLSTAETARFVLGHGENGGNQHVPVDGPRLAFIPLPSIEKQADSHAVIGSIRRAFVVGVRGYSRTELLRLAQSISGQMLIAERSREPTALLSRLPDSEGMIQRYTRASATWATVTPVILPGYDDRKKYRRRLASNSTTGETALDSTEQKDLLTKLDRRIDLLIRKAIRQAGYSSLLADNAVIEFRSSGFWPGTDLATRYAIPEKLRRFRRLHVRITWRNQYGALLPIRGPLCLGTGRFVGLGLFAPFDG